MDTDVIKAAYVLFFVPGQIPQKKGPFNSEEQIEKMLREMEPHYPKETQYFVAEVTHCFDLWLQTKSEFLWLQDTGRAPEMAREARAVRDAARSAIAHFSDADTAAKAVRVLARQGLLAPQIPA